MRAIGLSLIGAAVCLHFSFVEWEGGNADLLGINGYGVSVRPTFTTSTSSVTDPPGFGGQTTTNATHEETSLTLCAIFGLAIPVAFVILGCAAYFGHNPWKGIPRRA